MTEYRHRIEGGNGTEAIYVRRSSGSPATETYFVHRDQLGSPELITNGAGAVVVRLSFGAYGERRDSDWDGAVSSADMTAIGNTTRRGFTGHEHLDAVGLVHMNGRVYEPVIGRMLSPDAVIQIGSAQSVNCYAYVWNNPLTRTDPSGWEPQLEEVTVTATRIILVIGRRIDDPYSPGLLRSSSSLLLYEPSVGRWSLREPPDRPQGGGAKGHGQPRERNLADQCQGRNVNSKAERLKSGPDFYSISIPVLPSLVGISVVIDRYGQVYVGPGVGIGYPAMGVASGLVSDSPQLLTKDGYTGGDVWSRVPSARNLRNFLSGLSANFGAIVGAGANASADSSQHRASAQLMTPGFGVSYNFDLGEGSCPR